MSVSSHRQRHGACPCGSRQSFAVCCLPWEEALQRLLARLIAFAATEAVRRLEGSALDVFVGGEGTFPASRAVGEAVSLHFLEWFLSDYVPSREEGPLLGAFADGAVGLEAREEELLLAWLLAPTRAYEVSESPEPRGVVVRDLLTGGEGRVGRLGFDELPIRSDILICRLLPTHRLLRTGAGVLRLPATGREELLAYLRTAYQMGRSGRHMPLEDFLDASPHLYHHFFRSRGRMLGGRNWETLRRVVYAPGRLRYPGEDRKRILASLGRQPELERQEAAEGTERYTWVDLGRGCARAMVVVTSWGVEVRAETRDDLTEAGSFLEACLRGLIRLPGKRVEQWPESLPEVAPKGRRQKQGSAFLGRILGRWPDRRSPLLGGQSPREVCQSRIGRQRIRGLLLALERALARQKRLGRAWVDVGPLREELQIQVERPPTELEGGGVARRRRPPMI